MATVEAVVPSKPSVSKAPVSREPATSSKAQARPWTGEDRYRLIAEAAYFRAEARGFTPGSELSDWLAAEAEVDDILGDSGDC